VAFDYYCQRLQAENSVSLELRWPFSGHLLSHCCHAACAGLSPGLAARTSRDRVFKRYLQVMAVPLDTPTTLSQTLCSSSARRSKPRRPGAKLGEHSKQEERETRIMLPVALDGGQVIYAYP
jgi:hypothetical protein